MKKRGTLDFFAAGVPASVVFQMAIDDIRKLLGERPTDQGLHELCFIGLVAYFEAFCSNFFGSIINMAPRLVHLLKNKSYDVRIDPITALELKNDLEIRLGFLISEKLDFGTAKNINAHYYSLLGITPFGKKEKNEYDLLLSDRNLLVHHGGIYTQSYLQQKFLPSVGAFWDSLSIDISYLGRKIRFLLGIAKKIAKASKGALIEKMQANVIKLTSTNKKALKLLDYWNESVM